MVRDVPDTQPTLSHLAYRGASRTQVQTLFEELELGWGRIATRISRWAKD